MKTIHLKNNPNLRDLGGNYKYSTIRYGKLLRGRALRNLTKRQQEILKNKYGLKTVIDLRDNAERAQAPDIEIPGVKFISMPVFADEKVGISREERERADKFEILRKLPPLEKLYYEMLHDECLENIAKIIRFIVQAPEDEYAIYFHCSEGKDRTGIISAIILSMLDVTKEEIIQEYLYTNRAAKYRARRYYLLTKYIKLDLRLAQKLYGMYTANNHYINVLFEVIEKEYGDIVGFYEKALHLSKDEVKRFRAKMMTRKATKQVN